MNLGEFDRVVKRVYTEPKFRAQIEWLAEYGVGAQLEARVPRGELEAYVRTGRHPEPSRRVELVLHVMPDFDWWEPRHDQPWRRKALGSW